MKRRPLHYAAILMPSLMLAGCLSTMLGTKEERSNDYTLPSPGAGWERIDPAEADSAFRNEKDKAILNVSSVCGQDRFRSLEDLTQDVLKQLPDNVVSKPSEARSIGGYPGMITEAEGKVDGEALKVRLAVIRSSKCLYDIILAGQILDVSSLNAFEAAINGFKEKSDR